MKNLPDGLKSFREWARATGPLALALCLSTAGAAQDQSQQQDQSQPGQTQGSSQQPQANPKYFPQDADKPPYSHDRPQLSHRPSNSSPSRDVDPAAPVAASGELPSTLTIPAGTVILTRTNEFLSSDHNQPGDQFTAVLAQPIVVDGWVVARRGQILIGEVKSAKRAGKVHGVSQLGVAMTELTVADGRQMPIQTQLWQGSAGTSHGRDAGIIGTTTATGAFWGAVAGWGTGAAIGAGAGAAAGVIAVLLTRGKPTELPPETPLTFRLIGPVTVDTANAVHAFRPVTQNDINGGGWRPRAPTYAAPAYPPYPYAYPYAYPYYAGFYGYGRYYGYWGQRYRSYYRH